MADQKLDPAQPEGHPGVSAQLTLPGLVAPGVQPLPRRHQEMLRLYGLCEGHHCRDCAHLVRKIGHYRGHLLKCELSGITSSAATDWRAKFEACGRFERRQ